MEPPPASVLSPASSLAPPIAPPPIAASVMPAPAQQPPVPSQAQVASVVAATHVGTKRRHACQHVVHPHPAVAPAPASVLPPASSLSPRELALPQPPITKPRKKTPSLGPKGAAATKLAIGGTKVKRTTSRKKTALAPPIADPPPVVHEVLDGMPAPPTSFMGLLEDAEVDLRAPPLEPFGFGDDLEDEGDESEEGEDEEEVTEIEEEAFAAVGRTAVRSTNYSEAEDILLVRAWAHVGLDASTGTDQTGKSYWQRIEDTYCKIKPKTSGLLVGFYEAIADLRYKEMAASKGKAFPFKHVWKILQTFDKWKLRDQEIAPKKAAMLRMDDSDEEARNLCKPEGTKKAKLRKKMEGEASSIREKMEHMMKSREALTMKTLETKLLINEKKKEVKLAEVEARREEAKRKADLEERMIKVKEAKVWKELMVEEKELMMMSKKDMDEDQLMWWKEYKEDIAERNRIFHGASCTLRGDTPMSGGGDGGVEDSTTGDYGGA
ncbi:unnamed protein product [Alopecurus aequalis]